METPGESYSGTWQIKKWYPMAPTLPEWLVEAGSIATITQGHEQNGQETWVLRWSDTFKRACTVSGLTNSNGVLNVGQVNIEVDGLAPITTSGTTVGLVPTTEQGIRKIVVALAPVRDIGDDEPGTFTAQNPPGELPIWVRVRRALRKLFHLGP